MKSDGTIEHLVGLEPQLMCSPISRTLLPSCLGRRKALSHLPNSWGPRPFWAPPPHPCLMTAASSSSSGGLGMDAGRARVGHACPIASQSGMWQRLSPPWADSPVVFLVGDLPRVSLASSSHLGT